MAMNIAVSGMRVQQDKMAVIGNNIANSRTAAYKSQKMTFIEEFVSQAGQFVNGVRTQYGKGVKSSGITSNWEPGAIENSNNPANIAVSGEGFLPVRYQDDTFYTRAGDFSIIQDGADTNNFILMRPNGAVLLGAGGFTNDGLTSGALSPLTFRDLTGTGQAPTSFEIGASGVVTAIPARTWEDEPVTSYSVSDPADPANAVTWNNLTGMSEAQMTNWINNYRGADGIDKAGAYIPGATHDLPVTGDPTTQIITVRAWDADADYETPPTPDIGYTAPADTNLVRGIEVISGSIGVQRFNNPDSLERLEGGLYRVSSLTSLNTPSPSRPGSNGAGQLMQGGIENSNVDLVGEFTDMIITQRAFQANSKTITTADEMLQVVLNLKR